MEEGRSGMLDGERCLEGRVKRRGREEEKL